MSNRATPEIRITPQLGRWIVSCGHCDRSACHETKDAALIDAIRHALDQAEGQRIRISVGGDSWEGVVEGAGIGAEARRAIL